MTNAFHPYLSLVVTGRDCSAPHWYTVYGDEARKIVSRGVVLKQEVRGRKKKWVDHVIVVKILSNIYRE